ncbi:WG repeat-containing protein [Methylophaga sp.]|uniref:WG repeat-containing protein n=1 Tax=Methylophaga sp. TaxID=2024840 RepID=UPI003A9239F9
MKQFLLTASILLLLSSISPASANKVAIQYDFDAVSPFYGDTAIVVQNKQGIPHVGLINKAGEFILPPQKQTEITAFHEGLAPIRIDQHWGMINT